MKYSLPDHSNRKEIPEYNIWKAMRARCSAPSHKNKGNYQKHNIQVCERWNNFILFYEDMGPRPSKKHSIDRENSLGNYEPDNCRWATQKTQCENRGEFNILIKYNGQTKVLKQWATELNLDYGGLHKHITYRGKTFEQAIAVMQDDGKLEFNGERKSRTDWANQYGIKLQMLHDRLSRGWTIERALTQKPRAK